MPLKGRVKLYDHFIDSLLPIFQTHSLYDTVNYSKFNSLFRIQEILSVALLLNCFNRKACVLR